MGTAIAFASAKRSVQQRPSTTHLKSLQALELAVRLGSLKIAANRLGSTPAAIGQSVSALKDFLGTDPLLRGRWGQKCTKELNLALADLHQAFKALERVTDALDFQRMSEIHIVADTDQAELWLQSRLPKFCDAHPNALFCINGAGDVPLQLGSPGIRIVYGDVGGDLLFRNLLIPVTEPDNPQTDPQLRSASSDGGHAAASSQAPA